MQRRVKMNDFEEMYPDVQNSFLMKGRRLLQRGKFYMHNLHLFYWAGSNSG